MNNLSGKGIEGGHKTVLKMIATYILPAGNGLVAAAATINRRTESKPCGLWPVTILVIGGLMERASQ
jgi:hypothetical protein